MSGSDGEGGDFGEEDRREKKKKKKSKKERTPEEREERRRRKEAERNAEANASLGGDGDDGEGGPSFSPQSLQEMRSPSARGDDPESPGGASMRSRAGETSDDVPVKSKKPGLIGRVVGAASGAVVGAVVGALRAVGLASKPVDLNDGYDGPLFVKPSRAKARAYARDANVMQTRAGIKVYMEDDALEHLDGDEIFAEIYQQCERKGISVTKVTKTGTCAATVEDIPMSQAEDLAHFGVKIAGRHVRCVKEELPPLDGDGDEPGGPGFERDAEAGGAHPALIRPYNLRTTGPNELGELGVGIGLYFHSLLWGGRVLGFLSVLGAFTTVTYALAGTSAAQLESEALTGFAIPTLGAAIWTNENGRGLLLGASANGTTMLIITSVECFMALLFVWLVKRMKRDQSKAIEDMDVSNISLQDYAVKVDDVPRTATPAEIGAFFSKFGKVHQVTLGTDVGKLIGKHRKRSEMVFQREELNAAVHKSRGKSMVAKEQLRLHEESMEKLEASLLEAQKSSGTGSVTSAFVVFETEDSRLSCERKMKPNNTLAWLFRRRKYKFRGTHRLWIHRAPEASDVLWENLGVTGNSARARRFLSSVFMTLLMVCTCAMVVLAESAQSTVPPAIACDPPKEAGTLVCDAIWPAASYNGSESLAILSEVKAMMSQVNALDCSEYVSGGQWRDTTVGEYDGVARLDTSAYYDADGVWAGGFDASTKKDECSAMACFDCFCKTRVSSVAQIGIGLASDDDGWYELCETYFLGQSYGLATSAFTAVLNVLLGLFTRAFSEFERHHTKSGLESSVSIKLFLALVVNSALIPVLVFANISKFDFLPYLFQGPYTDFEVDWYQTVSATLSFTLVVNAAVFPLTALLKAGFKSFSRFALGGGALTQRQLNKMYEGDSFDLSERYAQMLSMVFVSLCFQAAMPALVPVTALFCYAVYHEAKYTLLRHSKKPPAYDETMARFFWAFAPSAAFFKLFFTLWMVSYATVPNLGVNIDPVPEVLETISEGDEGDQFDFSSRFENGNGAVAFFTFLALVVGTALNQNRVALVSLLNRFAPVRVFADEEEVSAVPDISIALSDGILKGLPSYMIGANPEYNEIVPASATLGAGGANQPRPPEWEEVLRGISEEEEERMRQEMKKMTATFTEEAAGEYSEDMRNLLSKKQKKKRAKGKVAPEDEESAFFDDKPQYNRKDSVAPLAWGDEGEGNDDEEEAAGDVGETAEEKAERRRRKKEKKEKKERRRREKKDEGLE